MPSAPKNPAPTAPQSTPERYTIHSDQEPDDEPVAVRAAVKARPPELPDATVRRPAKFPPTDDPEYARQNRLEVARRQHRRERQSDPMYDDRSHTRRFDENVAANPKTNLAKFPALPYTGPPRSPGSGSHVTSDNRRPPSPPVARTRSPVRRVRTDPPPWRSSDHSSGSEVQLEPPGQPAEKNVQVKHASGILEGSVDLGPQARNFMDTIRRDVTLHSLNGNNRYLQEFFRTRQKSSGSSEAHFNLPL